MDTEHESEAREPFRAEGTLVLLDWQLDLVGISVDLMTGACLSLGELYAVGEDPEPDAAAVAAWPTGEVVELDAERGRVVLRITDPELIAEFHELFGEEVTLVAVEREADT